MKIGNVEGSPEEITDFFQDNGLNMADYLEKPDSPMKSAWFIAPVPVIIGSIFWLVLFAPSSSSMKTFLFIIGCCAGLWLAASVQIRYKNTVAAIIIALGIILLMLVALGVITPLEMFQHAKELKK